METQMQLGDFFNYDSIIILVALVSFFILLFILTVYISNMNHIEVAKDTESGSSEVTQKKGITTCLLSIISMIVIFLGIICLNRKICLLLFTLPFILEKLSELFEGIYQLNRYLKQDTDTLTPAGKACVTVVALIPLLLSNFIPQEIKQIEISSHIAIVLLMILRYALLWESVLLLLGILIGEMARVLHKRKYWREIISWTKLKGFQSINSGRIWEMGYQRLINLHFGFRFVLIPIFYILCLIPSIICMFIFSIQRLIISAIIVLAYLVRFLEFIFEWLAECSDRRFIILSIKIALVAALLFTEYRIVIEDLVKPEIQSMYDYISSVILIPYILSEILEFKEKYRRET